MNQPDTITVRNWAIAITIGIALVVLFIILSLLKNYLWPEVYEAPEFRYERIKPIGQVNVGPIEVVAQTASAPKSGKEIFGTVCTACHSAGVLGAPKYGDKASWEPRIAKGEAVLIQSALNGFNKMPARGGQPKLSDEEIKATVQYMLEAVGASSNSDTKATSSSGTTSESSPPPKPESEGKANPTEGTTSESSPPPKPEPEGKANPTEGTTGESSPPPKPESEGKANPTENNSALPNTSSLASSSGAPKSTAPSMMFTQPQSNNSNSINKHLPMSARGQNNKVDLAPAGNNTHTESKVTEPQDLTEEISSQKKNLVDPTTDKIMTTDEVAKTALSTHAVTSSVINDKQATETTPSVAMAGEVSNSNPTSPTMTVTALPEIEQFNLNRGEKLYKTVCVTCHQQGIVGAPKLGDKANWAPRIAQGIETLFTHSIYGFKGNTGIMPPKGGQLQVPNEDIKAAVAYMISQVQ